MAAPLLTADQVELAKAIYEHFHAYGGWLTIPDLEYAEFKKRSTVDVNEALRAFPPRLGGYDSNNSFALSPRGNLATAGNVDETGDFIVALQMLVDRYDKQGPAATFAAQELVASGMSPARAARVFPLMQRESRIWRMLSGSSISDWKIDCRPSGPSFLGRSRHRGLRRVLPQAGARPGHAFPGVRPTRGGPPGSDRDCELVHRCGGKC